MVRSLTNRGMPKPFAILIAVVLALYFVPFVADPVGAAAVGDFEVDGNQVHESAEDWKDLAPTGDGVLTALPDAGGKTNRTLTTFLDNTSGGQDATVSGSNNKENPPGGSQWPSWGWTDTGNATGKSDYGRVAAYSYVKQVSGTDHVFLVLGFDRGSNVGGNATANYYFELNQKPRTDGNTSNPNPNRTTGDVRITINDQGNGVFSAPEVEVWTATSPIAGSWGPTTVNNPTYDVKANSTGAISDLAPWWTSVNAVNGTIDQEGFIEAALDLTSFGAVLGCPSTGFSTLNGRSSTGASDKNLVDYFKATPINIPSNCAALFVRKFRGDGSTPLGGATFRIEPNPLPVGVPGRPSDSFLTIFDDSDGNTGKEGSTNYDDPDATPGLISLPAVVPGVEYTITEVSAPDGWIKDGSVVKKTPVPFGTSQGQSNTASFTNHRGSVTFYKEYDGSDPSPTGASFTLTRDGDDADSAYDDGTVNVTDNGAGDDAPAIGVIMVDPLDAGSWKLVEDVGGAPTGWIRDGDEVLFTVPDAMGNRNVTLANPTLSDPRRTYPLEVHKVGVVPGRSDVDVEGTVFRLWRDSDGIAGLNRGTDTDAGSCQTGANGTCSVTGQAWGFDYFWEEVSVPAPWNLPNDRVVGPVHLNADGSTVPSGVSEFEDPRSAIETSATNGALPGGQIGDSATLTGIRGDAGGSITFRLWDNVACAGQPIFVSDPVAVDGPGTYGPVTTTVTGAGDYYWIATYSGDPNTGTRGVSGDCGDEGETSTVVRARPGITTVVPDSDVDLSDAVTQLTDNATLTGASATATGSISFTLYGPFGSDPVPGDCTGDKAVSTVGAARAFSGNGTYTSEPVTVGQAGIYTWKATYVSGDSNNDDATHPCGEESETVDVDKAEPTITTEAEQDEVSLGGLPTTLTDKAVLRGATTTATGSVTFSLYGPFANDPGPGSCTAGKLVRTVGSVQAFTGNRTYTSMPVVVDEVGYYTWVATYGGDGDNKSATHACGQAEETTRVNPARPTITTTAGDDQVIGPDGSTLTDTASLRGATSDATGRITFRLYGPFASDPTGEDGACVAGTLVDTVENDEVDGNDDYVSPGVSVKETGYYVWVATYGGDANNLSATHACGDASEVVRVRPRQPVITTEVPDRVVTLGPNGISLHDTATLSNATSAAGGTISFQLYGPFASAPTAESCADGAKAGAPLGTTAPVSGNGTYTSLSTKVTAAGYYTWIATYSGDANNRSATHPCGLETETVLVEKAPTGVTTVATTSAVIKLGQTISDAASVTGLTAAATGTVTFTLYGPGDTTCTGTPVFTSTVPLVVTLDSGGTGTGTATSEAYKPTTAGTYRWVAGYSGDGNNASSAGKCNDPNEQSVVRAGDNPNLDKASDPASGSAVQPGSTINYSVRVWNTGDVAITDADVVDILPPHVTVKESSISDGGVISADRTRITWKVTLAPADPSGTSDEKTLTYAVTVNRDAPEGAVLLNTARFLGLEDTTTHVVPTGDLTIVKEVSPVAGNGVVVEFGDKLTYTLSVHATGTLNQPDVVVTDYLPGLDPARPESGETTYVAGSATCTGAGACAVTEPGADGLVTWALGEMAAGTTRQVSFQVVIVDIPGEEGETVVADIYNTGAVQSSRTPKVRSNEVVTPVSKVLPVKAGQPPKELPRTGLPLPTRPLVGVALALLGVGLALVLLAAGGRPRGMHRISAR